MPDIYIKKVFKSYYITGWEIAKGHLGYVTGAYHHQMASYLHYCAAAEIAGEFFIPQDPSLPSSERV